MEITLPILILAIPIAMFLILGIGGVVMPRKLAGVLGILGMGTCLCACLHSGIHILLQRCSGIYQ